VNGLWSKMLRHIFSRKTLIMHRYSMIDLASLQYEPQDGLVFRELSGGDYQAFGRLLTVQKMKEPVFEPVFDIPEAQERLKKGGYCFVCEDNGCVVGYTWFASRERYLMEIQATIKLQEGQAYAYHAYVMSEYRGSNIFRSLLITGARVLYHRGFTGGLAMAMKWNKASRNILSKVGFSEIGFLIVGYFLSFRYLINTCAGVALLREAGPFEFYRKLFGKFTAVFSRAGTAMRMWLV